MPRRELALACAIVAAVVGRAAADGAGAGRAVPDKPPAKTERGDDVARADALFAEGIKLRDSNLEQACAKFGESLALNPQAIGTLLNVALCDEKMGRVASALHRFQEARARAVELDFPEHLKAADEKIAALLPEVPYLTIRFEKPPAPGTKVVVDDRVIALSSLEQLPVDPGDRVVVVSAPGRIAFQQRVSIAKRQRLELEVPALSKPSARRSIGKITLAAGAVATITGVVLGYVAHGKYQDQFEGDMPPCTEVLGGTSVCSADGQSAVNSARTLGNVGTVVGSVGVAAVIAGGYLWLFAPRNTGSERRVSVVPHASPDGGGIAVFGRF